MKKNFLLIVVLTLLTGCVGVARQITPHEPVQTQYAYVTGQYAKQYEHSYWSLADGNGMKDLDNVSIQHGGYEVYKVRPGKYIISGVDSGFLRIRARNDGLAYFIAAPGKITYIGDISFRVVNGNVIFSVADNSEQAKEYIKKNYPELGKNLDELFVWKPAQAMVD